MASETTELEPLWVECRWVKEKDYHVLRTVGSPSTRVELKHVLAWMKLPAKSPED